MDSTEQLLQSLTDAHGVPGYEAEVRAVLRDYMAPLGELTQDKLGFSNMPGGATDGGAIHVHGLGVPTVVMGVPARHIHSHGSIIHRDDFDHAVQLLVAVVAKLDAATVAGLTERV